MKKAAIIELSRDHHECLYSHIQLLSPKYECHIICSNDILNHKEAFPGAALYKGVKMPASKSSKSINLYRLAIWIKKQKYDLVMVNTLDQLVNRFLIHLLNKELPKFGVLHNASLTPRTLHALNGFFVTNEHLKKKFATTSPMKFHPCFFIDTAQGKSESTKVNIVIPGSVEPSRRDYKSLLNILPSLNSNISINILGSASTDEGKSIIKALNASLEECEIKVTNAPDEEAFMQNIQNADFILPLLNQGLHDEYKEHKTSGAFNLSIGNTTPLILPEEFREIAPSSHSHVYYKEGDITTVINNLVKRTDSFDSPQELNKEYTDRLLSDDVW